MESITETARDIPLRIVKRLLRLLDVTWFTGREDNLGLSKPKQLILAGFYRCAY